MTTLSDADLAVRWEPIPSYGDLMTLDDFRAHVRSSAFIDYDGSAYYATADQMSNVAACPSQLDKVPPPPWATHVMWFNR